jgi:hypothetical protein
VKWHRNFDREEEKLKQIEQELLGGIKKISRQDGRKSSTKSQIDREKLENSR